jgi:creatinine amidohydrolase
MSLFPDLMRPDLVPAPAASRPVVNGMTVSGFGTADFEGSEIGVPLEVADIAPNGVWGGDPRLSSAETGAAVIDKLSEIGARLAAQVAQWPQNRIPG